MNPRLTASVLAAACLVAACSCLHFSGSLIDDAFIFFRYADNLLAGHGPVFNVGERVEGFTSPLWLLLMAAGRAAGVAYPTLVLVLGLLLAMTSVLVSWSLARRFAGPEAALLAPIVMALHPALGMWSVHGLETALFVTLCTGAASVWFSEGKQASLVAGLLFGLAFWARPEAGLPAAVLAVTAMATGRFGAGIRLLAGFAAVAAPLEVFRLLYFGSPVPNTYFAKTGGDAGRLLFGLSYAAKFALTHAVLVFACAAAAVTAIGKKARPGPLRPDAIPGLAALGLAWSAWTVWIGGDAFPGYRFWLPVLPFACALAANGMERAGLRRAIPAVAVSLVLALATGLGALQDVRLEHETGREFTAKMILAGEWLARHAPPEVTIAVNYVGALPYHAGLRTIDMLGLTDATIARTPITGRYRFPGHARGNGAAVLDRRPELILMNGVYLEPEPMKELAPQLDTEEQIVADPRFTEEYRRVDVAVDAPEGKLWFVFYQRKDLPWSPGR